MEKVLIYILIVTICIGCGSKSTKSNNYNSNQIKNENANSSIVIDKVAKIIAIGQYNLKQKSDIFVEIGFFGIDTNEKVYKEKECLASCGTLPINRSIFLFGKTFDNAYSARTGAVYSIYDARGGGQGNEIILGKDTLPRSDFIYGILLDTIKNYSVIKIEEMKTNDNMNFDSLIRFHVPDLYSFVHRWDDQMDETLKEDTLNIEMIVKTIEGIDSLYFINYFKCGKRDNYNSDLYVCNNADVKVIADADASVESAYVINDTTYVVISVGTPGTDACGFECFQIFKKPN